MITLIDADGLAYIGALVATYPENSIKNSYQMVDSTIAKIERDCNADSSILFFTGKNNFRKKIYPAYKSHRSKAELPPELTRVREYMQQTYTHHVVDGLEADDLIGLWATNHNDPADYVMVSPDKDFKQIPGKLYNYNKPELGIITTDHYDAELFFYKQWLMGDNTDGYFGVPGVGPVAADELIAEGLAKYGLEGLWKVVFAEYEKHLYTTNQIMAQAWCARLLRYGDFTRKSNKIKLWTPNAFMENVYELT